MTPNRPRATAILPAAAEPYDVAGADPAAESFPAQPAAALIVRCLASHRRPAVIAPDVGRRPAKPARNLPRVVALQAPCIAPCSDGWDGPPWRAVLACASRAVLRCTPRPCCSVRAWPEQAPRLANGISTSASTVFPSVPTM